MCTLQLKYTLQFCKGYDLQPHPTVTVSTFWIKGMQMPVKLRTHVRHNLKQ